MAMKNRFMIIYKNVVLSMSDKYLTVAGLVRTQIKVKASKFIATVAPAQTVEAAMMLIDQSKKEFHDASHNVSAFKVGLGDQAIKRYNDDGEPAGSSGPSVLAVIEGEALTNLVIIVTRYFGGTKLGFGGLVRAYGDAAKSGLALAKIIERVQYLVLRIEVSYDQLGAVIKEVQGGEGEITDTQYSNQSVAVIVELLPRFLEKLTTRLRNATKGKAQVMLLEKRFLG